MLQIDFAGVFSEPCLLSFVVIFIYNENTHAKSRITKETKQKSRLGTASNEITWRVGGFK